MGITGRFGMCKARRGPASTSTSKGKSKAVKAKAGDGKITRFDPANPWPVGTVIRLVDAQAVKLDKVNTMERLLTLKWVAGLKLPGGAGNSTTVSYEEWDAVWASDVESVEFPKTPAGSMIEHGPRPIDVGKLDLDSAKPQAVPESKRSPRAETAWIPIDKIDCSRNVRLAMNEATLFELQESMADVGQLEPVLVRKIGNGFRMIAGHQRLEAARRAGETMIEAKVYGVGGDVDDRWEAKARAAENLIRSDLNHIELARLFGADADAGLTVAEIAAMHHVSDDSVRRHLALRRLCPPVTMLAANGRLPLHQAELISRVGDPQRQIALADTATRLAWDAKLGRWAARGSYDWRTKSNKPAKGEPTVADRDFVMPMEQLREDVASAMQGLAACGWPMGEDYAGKRRCFGCPDNTLTYADQPKLFEGIEPAGIAKKGYCTNGPCYEAKKAAWEKVVVQRRKEKERQQAKAVKTARAAGLDVCGADGCARVLAAGEKLVTVSGVRMCPKCAEKAKKRPSTFRGSVSGTREEREKRFPETPEQKLAVAIHEHGQAVAELIAKAIADGTAGSDGNCANVAEMILWAQGADGYGVEVPEVRPTVEQITGPGIPDADLAAWWREAAKWTEHCDRPGVGYDGRIEHVPLPTEHIELIADLEKIAAACGVKTPARPREQEETAEPGARNPEPGKKKKRRAAVSKRIEPI